MIHYSQRDSKWKYQKLGFGDDGVTIENNGCLLTASAMVLTNYGFPVTPQELNDKLKTVNGFTGPFMYFNMLSTIYPVNVRLVDCSGDICAPMELINQEIDNGRMVIVELDSSIQPGFQNHWVVLYERHGSEYYMSDPWSLKPENEVVTIEKRYGFAGKTAEIINKVLFVIPKVINTPSVVETQTTTVENAPIVNIPVGKELDVILGGLRLRTAPSRNGAELMMLPYGTRLRSAGDPIPDGQITWQPVLLYVAANYIDTKYIEPVT